MYPGKAGWSLNLLRKCNHPEVVDVVLLTAVVVLMHSDWQEWTLLSYDISEFMIQGLFILLFNIFFLLFLSKQMYLIQSLAGQGGNVAKSLLSSSFLRQFNTQKVFKQHSASNYPAGVLSRSYYISSLFESCRVLWKCHSIQWKPLTAHCILPRVFYYC